MKKTPESKKPSLMIVSSIESKKIAQEVALQFENFSDISLWEINVKEHVDSTLTNLLEQVSKIDYAIFVLTAEDSTKSGKKIRKEVRENIFFKMGLIMGRIGQEKVFCVKPKGIRIKLPFNLSSFMVKEYNPHRKDDTRMLSFYKKVEERINELEAEIKSQFKLEKPKAIKDLEYRFTIEILNECGDAILSKFIIMRVETSGIQFRAHEIFSDSLPEKFSNLELQAFNEEGESLDVFPKEDAPSWKFFHVNFRSPIPEGSTYGYGFKYTWGGIFSKEADYFRMRVMFPKISFELIYPESWECLYLRPEKIVLLEDETSPKFLIGEHTKNYNEDTNSRSRMVSISGLDKTPKDVIMKWKFKR